MNETLPHLLRAIASSENAKKAMHDIIFNAAADEIERLRAILKWLDRKGGLGLDVHGFIRDTLDGKDIFKP